MDKVQLSDIWFASAENMKFVKTTLKKEFVMPLKGNRKVEWSVSDKQEGRYRRADTLELKALTPVTVYLEEVELTRFGGRW